MPTGLTRVSDNEALIESSFRRLLASIESERETIRNTWLQIDGEMGTTSQELERLRQDTEEWCSVERDKIEKSWRKIDKLRDDYSVLWASGETLYLNCAGTHFDIPKNYLTVVEGSYLNHMFSNAFVASLPRIKDSTGRERYFLDFNPFCFGLVVEFMKDRLESPKSQPPAIPPEQQQNMDLLAEALQLKVFMRPNGIPQIHDTSLLVRGNVIQATLQGWQIISAMDPLPMSGASYFEVKVLKNPDSNGKGGGGLAIGVCGHVPSGNEIHSIRLKHAVLYNGNVGPVGDMIAVDNVAKGLQFQEGCTIGVRHNIAARTLQWYHNRLSVGSCTLRTENLENMRVMYPVFALFSPEQKIEVDFTAQCPSAMRAGGAGSTMGSAGAAGPGAMAIGDGSAH